MTTFKPSDIADIWENPNFSTLSYDERSVVLDRIIDGAADYARNAADYDAEVQRTMNKLIDASRAKLGSSESFREKALWAAGVAGQTVVDSAKVAAATAADMGVVQDNNQTGSIEAKFPFENVGKGLWVGGQGLLEAASHKLASVKNRKESNALEDEIGLLKKEIDDVRYPLGNVEELKAWLKKRDDEMLEKRRDWMKVADTQADEAAIKDQVNRRKLTGDSEILQNLVAYMKNRTPGAWDAVRRGLIETPTTSNLNKKREEIKETPVGRFLDTVKVGSDMLVAAGDPLDNLLISLIPVGKGAALASKGWKAGIKGAALGVAAETGSEVGSLFAENPDATFGEVVETMKAGAIGAGGLTAVGAAAGIDDQGEDEKSGAIQEQVPQTVEATRVVEDPIEPFDTVFGDQPYQFRDGIWYGPYIPDSLDEVDASPNLLPAMVPLNRNDPVHGSLIPQLENLRKRSIRKKAVPTPETSFAPPVQESKSNKTLIATEKESPNTRRKSKRGPLPPSLPDPSGDSDLISAIQRIGRLGVSYGPEWDWYRQLEKDAKASPLTNREADARARRGELEGDAKVTLAWLFQNRIIDAERGKSIDEAVEELTDGKNSDGAPTFELFNIDASSIGDSILAALDARVKAKNQVSFEDRMTEDERLLIEAENELSSRFVAHSITASGVPMSGNTLANTAVVGSTVNIGGKDFEVVDLDPTQGTVDVDGEFGWQRIFPDDELNVTSVDGEPIENVDIDVREENIPFSKADVKAEIAITQKENAAKASSIGLPTNVGVITNAHKQIKSALENIATNTKLNGLLRAIARALVKQSFEGVDLRIQADARMVHAAYYKQAQGLTEIGLNLRNLGRGQVDVIGTFLHEALHHATLDKIQNPQGEIELESVQALGAILKRVKAYAAALSVGKKYDYELSNVEEFVAALFTRPDFQEFLASIPADFSPKTSSSKFRSVLSEIMRILARLVTGKDVAKDSTMEQAMTATLALFDTPQRSANARAYTMPDGAILVPPGVSANSITAFHGTPHKVDKFTTAKIGTAIDGTTYAPADTTYLSQAPNAMRLVSARISEASESLREMLKEHKATRDERTVDGEPIERAGYLVRRDADMEAIADKWLDGFVEQQARDGQSLDEARLNLVDYLDREDVDVASVLLTRLIDERGFEFGFDPKEFEAIGQRTASRAGFALREWKKILDPLDRLTDEANTKTGAEMGKVFGVSPGKEGNPTGVAAQLNAELQKDLKAEMEIALQEAIKAARLEMSEETSKKEVKIQDLESQSNRLRAELDKALAQLSKVEPSSAEAELVSLRKQLEATQNDAAKYRESTSMFQRALDVLRKSSKNRKAIFTKAREVGNKLIEDALKRKRERRAQGKMFANPVEEFADDVAIGAGLMLKGIVEFAAWSKAMADAIGEVAQDYLSNAYAESARLYAEEIESTVGSVSTDTEAGQKERENSAKDGDPYAAIGKLKDKVRDLQKKLKEVEELLAEEKARADQELEVGIAIGREEGFAEGVAQNVPELNRFELWLMGDNLAEGLEGLPDLDKVAKRFIQPQRWNAEGFRSAVAQIFPALDENILDDAIARIDVQMKRRVDAAKRRGVRKYLDALAKRKGSLENDQRFIAFYKHIQKAAQLGILNSQVFADSFASAWGLNGLTPAVIAQLRQTYQQITETDKDGQPVLSPMERETLERKFNETINRIAPAQGWLDFVYGQFLAKVLSSVGSMVNQFSRLGVQLSGMSAIQRAYQAQLLRPGVVMSEWASDVGAFFEGLPMILNSLRGESLGTLPSHIASGHLPTSQKVQYMTKGERLRVGRGGRMSKLAGSRIITLMARFQELWTWRTIKAAEGLTSTIDSGGHFRMALTNHYISQGMKPLDARKKALADIESSPAIQEKMEERARRDQEAGKIGRGSAIRKLHAKQLLKADIDRRLGIHAVARQQQLTAHAQFKTMPTGFPGYLVSKLMMFLAPGDRGILRFFLMFPRFMGHMVDISLGYMPIAHLLNKKVSRHRSMQQQKVILEIFGSEEAYQRMVDARALSATALALGAGSLAMLALSQRDDDEDEPWFCITGSLPLHERDIKDAIQATGKWGSQQVRFFGKPVLSYSQLPELAPVLGVLGNISDAIRFNKMLYQRGARDREMPGSRQAEAHTIGLAIALDYAMSPISRSTYRQWVELIAGSMNSTSTGQVENWQDRFLGIATKPIEGMARFPVLVDVDKYLKRQEGGSMPDGFAESVLRRLPFAETLGGVGTETFNAYGERTPAWDIISMLPTDPKFSEAAMKAASINLKTGTRRGLPQAPSGLNYEDGSKREVTAEEMSKYYELSGKLYTEALVREGANILKVYEDAESSGKSGQASADVIVKKLSSAANKTAKEQLGLTD